MAPLPKWACPACGVLLLTLADLEAHEIHALPPEHIHVEVDGAQSLTQIDISAATPSGARVAAAVPPGQPMMSEDVARMRWARAGQYVVALTTLPLRQNRPHDQVLADAPSVPIVATSEELTTR